MIRNKLLVILLLVFITSNAWGVTQLKKVVAPSGGDYTSLEACMNANEQNLVTADKYFDVEIDGDWSGGADTTACTIHNYTTDSTRYINVYTKVGDARHTGKVTANAYALTPSSAASAIACNNANVTINGLTITGIAGDSNSRWYSTYGIGIGNPSTNCFFKNNLIYGFSTSGDRNFSGIFAGYDNGGTSNYIFNNIVYSSTNVYGITAYTSRACYVYGNTTCNCAIGIYVASWSGVAAIIKNNLSMGNTTDFKFNGGAEVSDYNGSVDATATGANSITGLTASNVVVNTSNDFHLKAGAAVIDEGVDLGSPYDYDIDGDFRDTYTPWDIGADEYVSAVTRHEFFMVD